MSTYVHTYDHVETTTTIRHKPLLPKKVAWRQELFRTTAYANMSIYDNGPYASRLVLMYDLSTESIIPVILPTTKSLLMKISRYS